VLRLVRTHTALEINEIIGLAWADDVSFDRIKRDLGVTEPEVIAIMRRNLKSGSFKVWRERVAGRKTKHERKRKILEIFENIEGTYL
jgi:uncharacterized protein (TIGR03643 family)